MYRHTVAAEPARPLLNSCFVILLVELPLIHFIFLISVSVVLLRTAGLPVPGLSSKSLQHDQRTSKLRFVLVYKPFHMFSSL